MSKRSRKGKRQSGQQRSDSDLLYGRQGVREALRAGRRRFHTLYLVPGMKASSLLDEIEEEARKTGVTVEAVERQQLGEWLGGVNHQGVALKATPYPFVPLDEPLFLAKTRGQDPLLLLLDQVQDPQNLGTLLRTAEACGVHGVILPRHRSAHVTPAVVNASAGAVEHLLVCQETNLVATIKALKAEGVWIAGLEAHPDAQALGTVDFRGPLGVVVGSEGYGLSRLVGENCDWLVELPMVGRIHSLNAAVAGSIMLFDVTRQRRN